MNRAKLSRVFFAGLLILLAGCEKKEAAEQKYLDRGKALVESGELAKAQIEFKNAARIMPTDAEPRYQMGLVFEKQGDLRNAYHEFAAAVTQNGHHDAALLKLASFSYLGGQNDRAAQQIAVVLADRPDDPDGHSLNAMLKLRNQDLAGAEAEARAVLAKNPGNVLATSALARVYAAQKDGAKAAAVLDAGLAANPNDFSLLSAKAEIFQQLNDYERVKQAIAGLTRLRPADRTIRAGAADYFSLHGHPEEAERTLREGTVAAPDDMDMKHLLIEFLDRTQGVAATEQQIRDYMKASAKPDELSLWLSDLYLEHHETDRAVALLKDIIARDGFEKAGLDARVSLAQIDIGRGDLDGAVQLIAAVLDHDHTNANALFVRASLETARGQYESAVTDLRAVLLQLPNSVKATELLAEALVRQDHVQLAIDALRQITDRYPSELEARVRLAQLIAVNGDRSQAEEILRDINQTSPDFIPAWERLIEIADSDHDWAMADEAIRHLEATKGQELTARLLRGKWSLEQGDDPHALDALEAVIRPDPKTPEAEAALPLVADIYRRQNQLGQGIKFVADLHTDDPVASTVLGELYLGSGKPDIAAAQFDQAIAHNATIDKPYIDRAQQLVLAGKTADAENLLRTAIGKLPRDLNLNLILGEIEIQTGEYQDAISLYQGLLSENPDLEVAANHLAELLADFHYSDPAALKSAESTIAKFDNSTNPAVLDTLGWVYFRENNFGQATNYLAKAAASENASPQAHYHYAMLLLRQERKTDAKHELQLAAIPNAKFVGVDEARKVLAGL